MRIFLAFLFFAQVLVHSTSVRFPFFRLAYFDSLIRTRKIAIKISENIVADWTMRDNSTSATQTIQNALDFVKNNIRRTAKYVQIADHTISFPYERGPLVSALRVRMNILLKTFFFFCQKFQENDQNYLKFDIFHENKIKRYFEKSVNFVEIHKKKCDFNLLIKFSKKMLKKLEKTINKIF